MTSQILHIGPSAIRDLLKMEHLIPLMESALIKFSQGPEKGGCIQPLREAVSVKETQGFLITMPAYSASDRALATKLVTLFPRNTAVPTVQGTIVLFSSEDGSILSLLDAEAITELRTAAASAVATKHLSKPSSKKLAILGSGCQARSHILAMKHVRNFDTITVWSPTKENREKFAAEFGAIACDSVKEAVVDADVIVTATLAKTPILLKEFVKEGAHINAVGAPRPDQQELDPELVRASRIFVDSRAGALNEAGDIILSDSKDEIEAEIGELAAGCCCQLKNNEAKRTTIFKNLGMAIEDVIAAKYVYDEFMKQK